MPDNEIIIKVKSENDTKAGFDAAKADAEAAGQDAGGRFSSAWDKKVQGGFNEHKLASWLDPAKADAETAGDAAGQGFVARFMSHLSKFDATKSGGGFGSESMFSSFGSFFTSPGGLAVAIPAVAALAVEITGVASGIAAAAAGLGAFGILSAGTFGQLKQDASQYAAAWDTLNQKQNLLAVTQANYAADPTKANKAALTAAQKGVAGAQNNLAAVQMGLGQDAGPAAAAINTLRVEYDKLSAAISPLTFKVVTDATKAVTTFLPNLLPFAQAGGVALDGLLQKITKFFASADFKKWLGQFQTLVGPSITAIGTGIGKVLIDLGKLFTLMSAKDVVHSINIAFDTIAGIIQGLTLVIKGTMLIWDALSSHIASFVRASGRDLANWAQVADNIFRNVVHWFEVTLPAAIGTAVNWFHSLPGKILSALGNLGGLLVSAGESIMGGLLKGIQSGVGKVLSYVGGIAGFIAAHKGPLDVDAQLLFPHGQAIMGGLMRGIGSKVPALGSQLAGITGGIGGHGYGGGPTIVVQVGGSGNAGFDAFMRQWLRGNVRILGGGSVQTAFGKAGM